MPIDGEPTALFGTVGLAMRGRTTLERWTTVRPLLVLALVSVSLGCVGPASAPPSRDSDGSSGETGGGTTVGDPTLGSGSSESGTTAAPPSVCGDGITDADELCDDGNLEDADGCSADCAVANCLVPVTHPTVQAGIDAESCSIVRVLPGTYTETLTIARDLELSTTDAGPVVIDAGGAGRTVTVTRGSVTLGALQITGGASEQGGGLYNSTSLSLQSTEIFGNLALPDEDGIARGGGVYNDGGDLSLVTARITDNEASGDAAEGGGVYTIGGNLLLAASAEVNDNLASAQGDLALAGGGGIFANSAGVLGVGNNVVSGNIVRAQGMGVTAIVARGGGIAVRASTLSLGSGSRIEANRAEAQGGTITGLFSSDGGGLHVSASVLEVNGLQIVANVSSSDSAQGSAQARAGAISVVDNSTVRIDASSIVSNQVTGVSTEAGAVVEARGGAIHGQAYETGTSVLIELTGCNLDDNVARITGSKRADTAMAKGGAVSIESVQGSAMVDLRLTRSRLHHNIAQGPVAAGGAVWSSVTSASNQSWIMAVGSTFDANMAMGDAQATGGAIHAMGGPGTSENWATAISSTFSGNTATSSPGGTARGGAVFAQGGTVLGLVRTRLFSSTLTDNTASRGGALYLGAGQHDALLDHSIVHGNSAPIDADISCEQADESISFGYNIIGPFGDCVVEPTDIIDQIPLLGPLQDNGGPTPTHMFTGDSEAIDGGSLAGCTDFAGYLLTTDQRGEPRPVGATCDLGSVEVQR